MEGDGIGTEVALAQIGGLALDSDGNLLIAEEGANRIFKLELETGIISVVAGAGHLPVRDGPSDELDRTSPGLTARQKPYPTRKLSQSAPRPSPKE